MDLRHASGICDAGPRDPSCRQAEVMKINISPEMVTSESETHPLKLTLGTISQRVACFHCTGGWTLATI